MMAWCRVSVADGEPALNQHWSNIWCSLGNLQSWKHWSNTQCWKHWPNVFNENTTNYYSEEHIWIQPKNGKHEMLNVDNEQKLLAQFFFCNVFLLLIRFPGTFISYNDGIATRANIVWSFIMWVTISSHLQLCSCPFYVGKAQYIKTGIRANSQCYYLNTLFFHCQNIPARRATRTFFAPTFGPVFAWEIQANDITTIWLWNRANAWNFAWFSLYAQNTRERICTRWVTVCFGIGKTLSVIIPTRIRARICIQMTSQRQLYKYVFYCKIQLGFSNVPVKHIY